MSLVEEYFELNEAEEVPVIWKVIQIAFYIFAAFFGLWCGYTIALLRVEFDDKCYLFTAIKIPASASEKIKATDVNWLSDSWCDYCQYSMVCSFIVATIWATFFLMCGKGGKSLTGLPQPWRIVWPSLVFNVVYFIVALSTAINIQRGTQVFCSQPQAKRVELEPLAYDCLPLNFLLYKNLHLTAIKLEIVTKTSWACAVSWLLLFLISLFRIVFVVDFNLYKICVFKVGEIIHNKREEVLRITNYEEPKKIQFNEERNRLSYVSFDEKLSKDDAIEVGKERGHKEISSIQPNTAFYVTTDIRMLNREKKRTKSFKLLDQAFEKSRNNFFLQNRYEHSAARDLNIPRLLSRPCNNEITNRKGSANDVFDDSEDSYSAIDLICETESMYDTNIGVSQQFFDDFDENNTDQQKNNTQTNNIHKGKLKKH